MPTEVSCEHNVVFTRRADPDPPVQIGESYNALHKYDHTFIRLGPILLRFYGDRERAVRMAKNMLEELNEKLEELGKEPSAEEFQAGGPLPATSRKLGGRRPYAGKRVK